MTLTTPRLARCLHATNLAKCWCSAPTGADLSADRSKCKVGSLPPSTTASWSYQRCGMCYANIVACTGYKVAARLLACNHMQPLATNPSTRRGPPTAGADLSADSSSCATEQIQPCAATHRPKHHSTEKLLLADRLQHQSLRTATIIIYMSPIKP